MLLEQCYKEAERLLSMTRAAEKLSSFDQSAVIKKLGTTAVYLSPTV